MIGFSFEYANINVKTKIYQMNGISYISLNEFAKSQSVQSIFYEDKEKMELRFPNHKLTVSPHSSFVKINDKVYHLYLPSVFDGNDFFLPAKPFLQVLVNAGMSNSVFDSSEEFIITSTPSYNIHDVEILNKSNGTEVKINTSTFFPKHVIAASITRGGWLNITIPGALTDSIGVVSSKIQNPIIKTRCIQSNESAQISLLLKTKVDDFDIETTQNEISISLRIDLTENANRIKEMRSKWMLDTIVIDAGHGGKDPGAIGKTGLQEKTVTLDIAKKLGKLVERNMGVNVIYTRDEDVFIPLKKRTQIANESNGKVFISIHANSTPHSRGAKGFETYLLRPGKTQDAIEVAQRENEVITMEEQYHESYKKLSNENLILATMAQSSFMKESEYLAATIQAELDKYLTSPNRGVKQAGFHVLVGASMPNVLIEVGFLTNKGESKLLGKSSYRLKIAKAIFAALVDFKNKYESPLISGD